MESSKDQGEVKRPEMSKVGVGLVLGMGAGIAFGAALDNIALGNALGAGIGLVFRSGWGDWARPSSE